MKRVLFCLVIVIFTGIFFGTADSRSQPEPASPVCEFNGIITQTLNRYMTPTDNINEIEGFSIKILNSRGLLRGDVEAYPTSDCSGILRRNVITDRWIGDQFFSDGEKKYQEKYFKVGNRLSGAIQLFGSNISNLTFYDSPVISSIQDGEFYTLSQLNTLFWAQDKPVKFYTEGYFMGISEGYLVGHGGMEIHYSASFTEIPIDIKELEEFERKIEDYLPYIREEKRFLYSQDLDINIPSRYNTRYFSVSEEEVERISNDLKQGELYELTITHSGSYGGDGFVIESYKLKDDDIDKDEETVFQPSSDNEDSKTEVEKKGNIFSRIWNFIKSLFK